MSTTTTISSSTITSAVRRSTTAAISSKDAEIETSSTTVVVAASPQGNTLMLGTFIFYISIIILRTLDKESVNTVERLRECPYLCPNTIGAVHRGAFCQFPFWWIYYHGGNKSTGLESGKSHLCAVA